MTSRQLIIEIHKSSLRRSERGLEPELHWAASLLFPTPCMGHSQSQAVGGGAETHTQVNEATTHIEGKVPPMGASETAHQSI